MTGAKKGTLTVRLASRDGSARQGEDYYGIYALVTFTPGELNRQVEVTSLFDGIQEESESFSVRLLNPSDGLTIATKNRQQITIADDNSVPGVQTIGGTISLEEGGTAARVISLTQTSQNPVTVFWATFPVTAVPGQDYYGAYQSVTIPAGETTRIVAIQTLDNDLQVERINRT